MEKGREGTKRGLSGFEAGMLIVLQSLVYGFGDPISKIAFEIEESATGISSVQKEQNECNFVFNLNGQRMAAPRKGFNIINGKKYIVR